jgi:ketosteroid isomerase-like protein
MTARLTEITGREARSGRGDALDALIDFYCAFNARDLDGLAANWEQGDAPSMDNPMGGIRRGWNAISEGYMKLFGGSAIVQVTLHDFTSQGGDDWHLFVGREIGTCTTPDKKMDVRFRTTRWFTRRGGPWRQLHHHGSIEEAGMLAAYQKIVLGTALGEAA